MRLRRLSFPNLRRNDFNPEGDSEDLSMSQTENMSWDDVEILIVGAGTMGASLAQTYAQSGFKVGVIDISEKVLEQAQATINTELELAQQGGIFSDVQVSAIKDRILFTTSYEQACPGKNLKLAIETVTEDIETKKKIFKTLDQLCAPDVIFASNTSSLDTNILAQVTQRPDKVVWMHFFYLPHKNRAAEYAGTDQASEESVQAAARYLKLAGKITTPILSSRKGGAADVIFVSLLLEAARMADEGYDVPSIETAGKKAYRMPIGFLELMDANGIPLGIVAMDSFADATNPEDPLYKTYRDFFSPPARYRMLVEEHQKAKDKSTVRWVSEADADKEAQDSILVEKLKERFLAVGFVTASEVVDAGVIEMDEVDKLCQNAFLWRDGPFSMMNRMGWDEVNRIVTERANLAQKQGIHFPFPQNLAQQAENKEPWPLVLSPIIATSEKKGSVARILFSNPKAGSTLDNRVFDELTAAFHKANLDEKVQVVLFDSAPIKTFIGGVHLPYLISNIKQKNFKGIREDFARWQDVLFHKLTDNGKAKIAIVDGATSGGGVEVALAFALDPSSSVIITERTSFSFPEISMGIYPGLRGPFTLPQAIYNTTQDAGLAKTLSRFCILAGGAFTLTSRMIKHLGLADFLVSARNRDFAADILAEAIIANAGKPLSSEQVAALRLEELSSELTPEENDKLYSLPDAWLASVRDLDNAGISPHALDVADQLVSKGFDDFHKGKSLDELAKWELENFVETTYQHPDAHEGLKAHLERRPPEFINRNRTK